MELIVMLLSVNVTLEGQYGRWRASVVVPELYRRQFEPVDACDDPFVSMATGSVPYSKMGVVMKTRKDAAEILAKGITEMIVSAMEKNDTRDGYPVKFEVVGGSGRNITSR